MENKSDAEYVMQQESQNFMDPCLFHRRNIGLSKAGTKEKAKRMATPINCDEYFERALAAPRGIAVMLESSGLATNFIQQMNHYRVRQRKQNKRVYPEEHSLHNKTPWDDLVIRKDKENDCRVKIEPARLEVKGVEEL